MKSTLLRIEVFTASLLPTTAVLLIGMVAMKQIESSANIGLLLLVIIASSIGVFLGEVVLIRFMQRATKEQFYEIILTCQQYIAGDRTKRLNVYRDNALTTLTHTLNSLLESVSASQHRQSSSMPGKDNAAQASQLNAQLQKLILEITPVMSGDLRVQIHVPAGNVGTIADICQALIEEIVELLQWTRYSSKKVIVDTRKLLESAVELAQAIETQMLRFSQTTETVEQLVAFLQRLTSTLQLNVDAIQETQKSLRQYLKGFGDEHSSYLEQLDEDTGRQTRLLEEVLDTTQFNTLRAESMISDFYTFAKRIHQSSANVLQTAEQINALSTLADQWYNATIAFHLPDNKEIADISEGAKKTTHLRT